MNKLLTKPSKITLIIIAALVMLFEVRIFQGATRGEAPFFIPVIAIITASIGIIGQIISPSYWSSIVATGLSLIAAISVYLEVIVHYGFSLEALFHWFVLIAGTYTVHLVLLMLSAYLSVKIRCLFSGAKS
jgi:hypothetical protein